MTIASNKVITYNDLIEKTLDFIESKCANVTSSVSVVAGYANTTHPNGWNNKDIGNSTKVTMTVNDDIVQTTITRSDVKADLEDFLRGRNIYSLGDTEISHKSLINLVSNISSFVCAKVTQVVNNFSTNTNGYLIYAPSLGTSEAIVDISNLAITKTEVENNVKSIVNVNSLSSNVHTVRMNVSYNCSSSSSSCSSSSCSSSSSLFIAYMNIN